METPFRGPLEGGVRRCNPCWRRKSEGHSSLETLTEIPKAAKKDGRDARYAKIVATA